MKKTSTLMEQYALTAFLVLTLLISLAIPLYFSLPQEVVPLMIAIIPAILAIILTALTVGRKGVGTLLNKLFQWRVGFKWYLVAFGLALVLRLTMSVLALLFVALAILLPILTGRELGRKSEADVDMRTTEQVAMAR